MAITITQIIAHDMDLNKEKPDLATSIINLTSVPAVVFDFFIRHINNSLNARQVKACKFNNSSTNVQSRVIKISNNKTDIPTFVNETQELTKNLFEIIKSSSSNSGGALFFLVYTNGIDDYFAILKMDPNRGIQINKADFTIKVQEDMLPNPEDKLHKCAFFKLVNDFSNEANHVQVLDRQQKTGEVSKYFMNTFLQASEILNDKIMTDRVINKLIENTLQIVPENRALDFQFAIDKMFVNGKDVDLDLDLEKLVVPFMDGEKQRADFIENFKTSLRSDYEDVKFQFKAEKDPTTLMLYTPGKEIKIEFPLEFLGSTVIVDEPDKGKTVITINKELKRKNK